MFLIDSKRKKRENILKKYPDAIIADVISHVEDDLIDSIGESVPS